MEEVLKIGILTFHAAYNFGAELQAFALSNWIENNVANVDVELIDYQPKEMDALYSLNPFYGNVKNVIKRSISIPQRYRQIKAFKTFQNHELSKSKKILSEEDFLNEIKKYQCVIYGSDQIWNHDIVGDTDIYWGYGAKCRKIAYAASFGNDKLTDRQKNNIIKYLKYFESVTVRESQSIDMIKECSNIQAQEAVDPVFLLGERCWKSWACTTPIIGDKYILYYSLRRDDDLIRITEELSKTTEYPVIIIHPIAQKQHVKGTQLYDIDPMKFVNLIEHCEYVCTNSFHAMAFACIFKKKAIHKYNKASKGRVGSLLDLFEWNDNENTVIDFSELNYNTLNELIEQSKMFLKKINI